MTPTPEMPMTPGQRAKKIGETIEASHKELKFTKDGLDYIAAQIREAEKEAYKRGEQSQKACELSFKESFNIAREKVAHMVESCSGLSAKDLADRIRAIRPTEEE